MSANVIIFDFDGTLADTLDAVVNITNRLAGEFGYQPTAPEQLAEIRNLSSREIVKQSGISVFKLPFLLRKVKEELRNDVYQLKLVPEIKDALVQLHARGNVLGIVTSNSEENVRTFLEIQGLRELFSFIYSGTALFGKHKVLRKFLRKNNLTPEDVIYVGDETRDIEASMKIRIKVVAVSWGFNSAQALAAQNPDFLIHHPRELVEVLGSLQRVVS